MNDRSIQSIELTEKKMTYQMAVWMLLLSGLLTGGSLLTLAGIWKGQIGHFWVQIVMAVLGIGCCIAARCLKSRFRYAGFILVIPWPLMLALSGFRGYLSGMIAWLNLLITRWNASHEQDIMLLSGEATIHDLWASTLFVALLCSEIAGLIVSAKKIWLACLYAMVWICVQLFSSDFSALSSMMLMIGFLGIYLSGQQMTLNIRGVAWLLGITCVLGVSLSFVSNRDSVWMTEMHQQVVDGIKVLRFGHVQLPEGKVNQADRLKENKTERLMTVTSEQAKTLYLKSFSGGRYVDGCWKPLSNTDFGGTYAGMLEWLNERSFDVNMQPALYYQLSTGVNQPEENEIKVSIDQAFRKPVYLPASLEEITGQDIYENKDSGMLSRGITGIHRYAMTEISDGKPAELMVAGNWLDAPQNDAQAAYVEAESVYRDFVYTHYLTVDEETEKVVRTLFWDDYDTENDGIYRAVCQIRDQMEAMVTYTDSPDQAPEGEDPVLWFLTKSHSGNDVQYASAAVEAFRVHGIPARYAEGYYIADTDFSDDSGKVTVTGDNAHAWVEVYFDGIGWLPIEVTPGYYFDAMTLSQMVNTSNVIRKTAAMDDDASKAQPMIDGSGESNGELSTPLVIMRDTALVLLGFVVLLAVCGALLFAFMEIMRICLLIKEKENLKQMDDEAALQQIARWVFFFLELRGIHAHLGWESDKTDAILSEQIPDIAPGDYSRVCGILEKAIYGGCVLMPFEMRTLRYFLEKLSLPQKTADWKLKLRLRYAVILIRWHGYEMP